MQKPALRLVLAEIGAAVVLTVFILAVLKKPVNDDVSLTDLKEALLSASFDRTNMKEGSAMKLKALYGLSENDYETVCLYVPSTNMDAQEMLLIRCKEETDTAKVREAMEKRIEAERNTFNSYGIEQMALIDKAFTEVRGRLCLYVCDKNSDKMREAFLKAVQ